jgi:hypothetical protein
MKVVLVGACKILGGGLRNACIVEKPERKRNVLETLAQMGG